MLGLCGPFLAGSPRSDWPQRPPRTPRTPGENLVGSMSMFYSYLSSPCKLPPLFIGVCVCVFEPPTCGDQIFSFTMWVPGIKLRSSGFEAGAFTSHLVGPVASFFSGGPVMTASVAVPQPSYKKGMDDKTLGDQWCPHGAVCRPRVQA